MNRPRRRTALALAATIAAGLASRRWPLPGLLAEYAGDALYATAAFWLLALLRPNARTDCLAAGAFLFAASVEFSQLLHLPWLDAVRAHALGRLVLGQGFQWADLASAALGAGLGAALDRLATGPRVPAATPTHRHRAT